MVGGSESEDADDKESVSGGDDNDKGVDMEVIEVVVGARDGTSGGEPFGKLPVDFCDLRRRCKRPAGEGTVVEMRVARGECSINSALLRSRGGEEVVEKELAERAEGGGGDRGYV